MQYCITLMGVAAYITNRGRHPMTATTQLNTVTSNLTISEHDGERVIDFDIQANTDYEIQSCVIVDETDRVIEAAVRFGRIDERPDLGIGTTILANAWRTAAQEATGYTRLDPTALKADLSDFGHTVPHLRVERENVEEYDCETLTLSEFAAAVDELATFASDVLRGSDETIDQQIDAYL